MGSDASPQDMSVNWMVGGPQGSGVDSAAKLFALTVARAGLHVVGQREYYSNIMGKHSYYKIRASEHPIKAARGDVHLLATYDEETIVRHVLAGDVVAGGAILFDADHVDGDFHKLPNMDKRVKQDVAKRLEEAGHPQTVGGVLELAKAAGVKCVGVPYDAIIQRVAKELDLSGSLVILRNTCAVGASLGALGLPANHLDDTVRHIFADKKEKVHNMNILAAKYAAEHVAAQLPDFEHRMPTGDASRERVWIQGTQAVALGKIAAGCRLHTYYPISPATDEATYLESLSHTDMLVVQTEDEIAAATMAIGAALTGARATTSTSGPGFCLMAEAIGYAGMCEVPLVVIDYQRGGPSTGLPTRTEQGDLQFALRMGHGDLPRIVICPGDPEELFWDTIKAFEWAERYQMCVIMLPDKALAGNSVTMDIPDISGLKLDRGRLATAEHIAQHTRDGKFSRYAEAEDGISVRSLLGQKDGIHWLTGDEHTDEGHITEDVVIRDAMVQKRWRKLDTAAAEIPAQDKAILHGPADADVTIVSWGSTKGAILEALDDLQKEGITANFLQYRIMSPFPMETKPILEGAKRVVSIEENQSGQLRDLIAEKTGFVIPHKVTKTNGRPTMVHEVVDAVMGAQNDVQEVLLTHGC